MFSGIVEEMGVLLRAEDGRYRFGSSLVAGDLVIGDSVAVNGAASRSSTAPRAGWRATCRPETLRRTTLGDLEVGDPVNLERPVRLADRLSGHVVQGHVDAVGEVLATAPDLRVDPPALMRYCVEKGSIALDGVSLTISTSTRRASGSR